MKNSENFWIALLPPLFIELIFSSMVRMKNISMSSTFISFSSWYLKTMDLLYVSFNSIF